MAYFVIPSAARNPGLCRLLQKPRSLTSFGMKKQWGIHKTAHYRIIRHGEAFILS